MSSTLTQHGLSTEVRSSWQNRRLVQKIISNGDRQDASHLVVFIGENIGGDREAELAAIEACNGLSRLLKGSDEELVEKHQIPGLGIELSVPDLLLLALEKGGNSLQAAASSALGELGNDGSKISLQKLLSDENATVRARAKRALRQLEKRTRNAEHVARRLKNRRKKSLQNRSWSSTELDFMIASACSTDEITVQKHFKDTNAYVIEVKMSNGRTQLVNLQTNLSHSSKEGGEETTTDYVAMYTTIAPVTPGNLESCLRLNAMCLEPKKISSSPFGFSKGAIAVWKKNLVMVETEHVETLSPNAIRHGILSIAEIGDALEEKITGGDSN